MYFVGVRNDNDAIVAFPSGPSEPPQYRVLGDIVEDKVGPEHYMSPRFVHYLMQAHRKVAAGTGWS